MSDPLEASNLILKVAKAAHAKVGLVARPERDGGDHRVVNVRLAVGQTVRAEIVGNVLEHDAEERFRFPRVAEDLRVLLEGKEPRGAVVRQVVLVGQFDLGPPILQNLFCCN